MKQFVVGLACTVVLSVCCGCDRQPENTLVRFKGGALTTADVEAHLESMKRKSQFRDRPETLTPEFVFHHALNMEMIIAKGLDEDLHNDPRIRDMIHEYMSDLFLKIMERKLITQIDRNTLTEEEMRQFYEEHKDQYQEKSKYALSAFTASPEQAREAAAAIKNGELDFAAAATKYAQDEESRKTGGKTGTRTLRLFQPSWRPVVEKLEVGVVSGPIELDGKTWLLRLERKTEPQQYSFEEKKEYIRNDVLYGRYRTQWDKVYDELKKQYDVKIDQKRLDAFFKEAQAPLKVKDGHAHNNNATGGTAQ